MTVEQAYAAIGKARDEAKVNEKENPLNHRHLAFVAGVSKNTMINGFNERKLKLEPLLKILVHLGIANTVTMVNTDGEMVQVFSMN